MGRCKKIFLLIAFNIFAVFFILIITELIFAYINYYNITNNGVPPEERKNCKFVNHLYYRYINYNIGRQYNDDEFRVNSNENIIKGEKAKKNLKGNILLMGCSFTYGVNLKDNETFSSQLSKYTKRNVYNFGLPGGCPREMLDFLRTNRINNFNIDKNNIEYVIYTYIWEHQIRLYSNLRPLVPNFRLTKDNKLIEKKIHWWEKSFFISAFTRYKFFNFDKEHSFDLFIVYMDEINKEIQKKFNYKNTPTKFIILVYDGADSNEWDLEKLNHEKIKIIKVKDLIGREIANDLEFRTFDEHPSAKAWQVIVPALAKELNL